MKRVLISSLLNYLDIFDCILVNRSDTDKVIAAISTKEISKNLVRGKSSNIWSYGMNVRNSGDNVGDMVIQFKGKDGGPTGGLYIYYDVPVRLYRKFISSPSLGHFFWKYIRNVYKYSKLDGDKRGKLPNAVN